MNLVRGEELEYRVAQRKISRLKDLLEDAYYAIGACQGIIETYNKQFFNDFGENNTACVEVLKRAIVIQEKLRKGILG